MRNVKAYKIEGHNDRLCDPAEEEFTREEDTSYMNIKPKSPRSLLRHSKQTPTNASDYSSVAAGRGGSVSGSKPRKVGMQRQKVFSLKEQQDTIMDIWQKHVQTHYRRKDDIMVDELPVKPILQYFVKAEIALDRDKAKQAIEQEIGSPLENENMISLREFSQVFCRSIFKQALIRSAETFMQQMSHKSQQLKDMTLKQKIDSY